MYSVPVAIAWPHTTLLPPLRTFVPEFLFIQKKEVMITPWNYHLYPLLVYPVSTFISIRREKENFVLVPTLLPREGTRAT